MSSEPKAGRNLALAIPTGLVLASLIFLTLFTSRPAFFILVSITVLTAQHELYRVMQSRGFRPAEPLGVAAGALLLLGAYHRGTEALAFGLTMSFAATALWFLVDPERENATEGIAATLLGIIYVPFLGAHVVLLHAFPDGAAITIGYIGLVAFYDIGAYITGIAFGRHLIAPTVSPKKSWEGAAGATVFVIVVAAIVGPLIGPFTLKSAVLLALVAAVLSPLGDLAESMLKRDLDVKDMGSILPGHGGVLDRIDALLLVAPAAYWLVRWVVF